jgi:hypothetical protein
VTTRLTEPTALTSGAVAKSLLLAGSGCCGLAGGSGDAEGGHPISPSLRPPCLSFPCGPAELQPWDWETDLRIWREELPA